MQFARLIGILARSSAQAVSTLHLQQTSAGSQIEVAAKEYLYVATPVESELLKQIEANRDKKVIIFLCGSSGDGKSEILTRYYRKYGNEFLFHLDATHSFSPDKTAIATLNEKFSEYKNSDRSMVVGINTGMMGNYVEEGSEEHVDIRTSMRCFLDEKESAPEHIFVSFDRFSKFEFSGQRFASPFIEKLLYRLTEARPDNPFWTAYSQDVEQGIRDTTHVNYELLALPSVQRVVVETLLKARLKFDQFLTSRGILDFIHHLVGGKGLLFDNLFEASGNDLVKRLEHFDPCNIRSRDIDRFIVQQSIRMPSIEFAAFKQAFATKFQLRSELSVTSWLRAFYVLQGVSIGNNFHRSFQDDFGHPVVDRYIETWSLHQQYDGQPELRIALNKFYKEDLIEALKLFMNRFFPVLTESSRIYLSRLNDVVVATELDIKQNLAKIARSDCKSNREVYFLAHLKVNDRELPPLPININFFELILNIKKGYRPNKHDKNSVVILDELISEITTISKHNKVIYLYDQDEIVKLVYEADDDQIEVAGRQ